MKASLVTSAALHGVVLFWALFSLGGPRTLNVADVEALPIDIVPVESITRVQKGDKKAPAAEKAAPKPTIRPDPVENAQEVGNNSVDLKGPPTPKQSPREVEAAAPPKQSEKPAPQIDDNPVAKPQTPPDPTEVASLPKPEQPAEAKAREAPPAPEMTQPAPSQAPEFASLPEAVPTPQTRPQPPKPEPKKPKPPEKAAQQPDRKTPEPKPAKAADASSAKKDDFDADKIAALLNREDPSGGGAKRSTETAALGTTRTTTGQKLTQSEMDALRAQIEKNWNIIPGMAGGDDVRVQVTMRLDPSGAIVGTPEVTATGGSDAIRRTLAGSARRAVLMSSPFRGLPPDKYDAWSEVVVNFDPSQLY